MKSIPDEAMVVWEAYQQRHIDSMVDSMVDSIDKGTGLVVPTEHELLAAQILADEYLSEMKDYAEQVEACHAVLDKICAEEEEQRTLEYIRVRCEAMAKFIVKESKHILEIS